MRLTTSNIKFVKRYKKDGVTYMWFLAMKSGRVSDSREYINYDESGKKTCVKEYPAEWLPKTIQNFINSHEEHLITDPEEDNNGFEISIYG